VGHTVPEPMPACLCANSPTPKSTWKQNYADEMEQADSYLVLSCGQGIHTVIDATGKAARCTPAATPFSGARPSMIPTSPSSAHYAASAWWSSPAACAPLTLCSKQLLNGPCGGAENGKCEVDAERDCGWVLIYERLKKLGRMDSSGCLSGAQKPRPLEPSPLHHGGFRAGHLSLPGRLHHHQQPGLNSPANSGQPGVV
jgi:hypothetical protein